jgi:hypothetical protein
VTNVKKFRDLSIAFLLACCAAAIVAYSMAHVAHYGLGISSSDLRNQALTSAAVLFGFVAVEFLVTSDW